MKDGRTHLAYKAEHVVDLKSEVILAAEVYPANEADTDTLVDSVEQAQAERGRRPRAAARSRRSRRTRDITRPRRWWSAEELELLGVKTYIPEPELKHGGAGPTSRQEQQAAVYANRRRSQRATTASGCSGGGAKLVERSFAHVCDTGGWRRSWLRGLTNVRKRYLIAAAAHNLGLILRKLLGAGKPRAYDALLRVLEALYFAQLTLRQILSKLPDHKLWRTASPAAAHR